MTKGPGEARREGKTPEWTSRLTRIERSGSPGVQVSKILNHMGGANDELLVVQQVVDLHIPLPSRVRLRISQALPEGPCGGTPQERTPPRPR